MMTKEELQEEINKQNPKVEKVDKKPSTRQILIETDGNNIYIKKAEVSGNLEFQAILQAILKKIGG